MTKTHYKTLLEKAEWEVQYAEGEVVKAQQMLELRQLALDNLKIKYETQL